MNQPKQNIESEPPKLDVATMQGPKFQKRLTDILSSAAEVIAERGFQGASVREVATRGGIGLSGIYYYFKSKEEMLFAIQRHTFTELIANLRAALDGVTDPEVGLRKVVENHLGYFFNHPQELKVCFHELDSLSGDYYDRVLSLRREYYDLVRAALEPFSDSDEHTTSLNTLFLFGSLNWVNMWYDPAERNDSQNVIERLVDLYLGGIRRRHK